MNRIRYRTAHFVLLSVLILCSPVLGQEDSSTLFHCQTPDTVQPPAALAGQRTLSPVAIYACSTFANANNRKLPSWYDSIWTPAIPHSVPKFYKDNSLKKYIFNSDAFGLNNTHCFTFSGQGADVFQDRAQIAVLFQQVMPQADDTINFADFDIDGPNGMPDGIVDGLSFMIVNHKGNDGFAAIEEPGFGYTTRDTNLNGDTVKILSNLVVVVKTNSRERAVALSAHEWGHVLGLPELYGNGWASLNTPGWWGLGAFSIMGRGEKPFQAGAGPPSRFVVERRRKY